ncbi:hypothetical protein LTR37_005379 [Vermiconidia calcicola]|uniref:Uncharacterized protein n=1 Tax=Vermiconidia calcicola TaxID=1690605 RepID=A0ACC3NLZ3_9PEZI|nr:hypothetical protein LTR37_005379 [Vermiconidia calcicola]
MASFPASFVRGGTSNGLIIDRSALPQDQADWQPILSSAMGSPDPHGRQLNGMGSGISSTSKICVISESNRDDADVDYTFVQVGIKGGDLDMAGNCGNMSSAVGPVAWDQGLANCIRNGGETTVRMFNVNTSKIVHSTFSINAKDSKYEPRGNYSVDGVNGTGSRITLAFQDPAGSKTGKALPTGNAIDTLDLPDGTKIQASLVDVANPGVFVRASDLDLPGDIAPEVLGGDSQFVARLEEIRRAGAQLMGLDPTIQSVPKIVLVSKPEGENSGTNIVCRALSMQQPHKAVPLTLALNLGTACKMPGTIPATVAVGVEGKDSVIVAHASGKVEVGSVVKDGNVESALLHRTARVLMKGDVFYTKEQPG